MAGMTRADLVMTLLATEENRTRAITDTGSFLLEDALRLHDFAAPHLILTAVEWGTYLGRSALALAHAMAKHRSYLYTCDAENDAFPATEVGQCLICTRPMTTSTTLLTGLVKANELVDLFFFDGFIYRSDLPLILQLAKPSTLYVFDDYRGNMKGTKNVPLIRPQLDHSHRFVEPVRGSGLAYYLPK